MDFLLSPELIEFQSSLRRYFDQQQKSPSDLSLAWSAFAELGAVAGPIGEELGGLGFGFAAAQLAIFESSRALTQLPVLESIGFGAVVLQWLYQHSRSTKGLQPILQKLAEQGSRASGAYEGLIERSTSALPRARKVTTSKKSKSSGEPGWDFVVSGAASLVPSVGTADLIIVPAILDSADRGTAKGEDEPKHKRIANRPIHLFAIQLPDKHCLAQELQTLDLLRNYGALSFKNVPATCLTARPLDSSEQRELIATLAAITVSDMLGATARAIEMTLEHVKTRKQFGRTIGSFQAIKHKLADAQLEYERCLALSRFVGWCAENDRNQFELAASGLKAQASRTLPVIVESLIQAHGGVGFTYEYPLHLCLRRVRVLAALLGGSEGAAARVAAAELALA